MSWGSSLFKNALGAWLAANNASSDQATAEEIALTYGRAARSVNPIMYSASKPAILKPNQIIAAGFIASFKLARIMKIGKPSPLVWLPAATSIVAYWTAVPFTPMPPPPGGLVGAANVTTFPGLPTPLNFQIGRAFQKEDPYLVADALDSAFKSHLKTVAGLWTGTAPAAPSPIPYVFPWVALK
tara:strand:- start:527 stop:1078 length:552 start_codon:yes stop_codon:yes gene_type:complete